VVELDGDVVAEEGLNKWGDGWRFVAVNVRMILGLAMVCGGVSAAEPLVVDDAELLRVMCGELGKMAESGEAVTGKALAEMLEKAPREVEVELPARVPETKGYEDLARSVFMLGSVYDCGKCDQWHSNGNATAWCLTPDGVMVTNHHVFQSGRGDAWGVCGVDGKVYRVTEILAADGDADVAIFRVDVGEDALRPLALGGDAGVGVGGADRESSGRAEFFPVLWRGGEVSPGATAGGGGGEDVDVGDGGLREGFFGWAGGE
jgi:hypothetical protein